MIFVKYLNRSCSYLEFSCLGNSSGLLPQMEKPWPQLLIIKKHPSEEKDYYCLGKKISKKPECMPSFQRVIKFQGIHYNLSALKLGMKPVHAVIALFIKHIGVVVDEHGWPRVIISSPIVTHTQTFNEISVKHLLPLMITAPESVCCCGSSGSRL